jgi:hypothetical protein
MSYLVKPKAEAAPTATTLTGWMQRLIGGKPGPYTPQITLPSAANTDYNVYVVLSRDSAVSNVLTIAGEPVSSAWDGTGRFVSIGNSLRDHVTAWSSDGKNWTEAGAVSRSNFGCIAYGGGVLLGFDYNFDRDNGTTWVSRSQDGGKTWKASQASLTGAIGNVAYGGGVFVALLANSKIVLSGDKGKTWTSTGFSEYSGIAYGKK